MMKSDEKPTSVYNIALIMILLYAVVGIIGSCFAILLAFALTTLANGLRYPWRTGYACMEVLHDPESLGEKSRQLRKIVLLLCLVVVTLSSFSPMPIQYLILVLICFLVLYLSIRRNATGMMQDIALQVEMGTGEVAPGSRWKAYLVTLFGVWMYIVPLPFFSSMGIYEFLGWLDPDPQGLSGFPWILFLLPLFIGTTGAIVMNFGVDE